MVITSNRDEKTTRPAAIEPKQEMIQGRNIVFPKDPMAGGTWFATSEQGNTGVLLNGAFEKHISKDKYVKSRGLILLDIISHANPLEYLQVIDLKNIEPFTLILFAYNVLIEFRWDEERKHFQEKDIQGNYIWSSSTLYAKEIRETREKMFHEFISREKHLNEVSIKNFHNNNENDFENGFIINRNNQVKTFSITQAVYDKNEIQFFHNNLLNHKIHLLNLKLV